MALKLFRGKKERNKVPLRAQGPSKDFQPADSPRVSDDPLESLLQRGRYGIIAAAPNRWKDHPGIVETHQSVLETIDNDFGYIPEGCAALTQTIQDTPGCEEIDVVTNPFLLAKHCVTNAEFQRFVDGGGYDELELWPRDIWPHLIDFQDLTGTSGPRYWRKGRHDRRLETHPVVGICFYEAESYARWVGYRLPTEAEWQMAASWRIRSSAQTIRRYPWGDALDTRHCNVWATGVGGTAPVEAYSSGAAPNGVLQLAGNVWEWTACDFTAKDDEGRNVVGDMILKSIRGGAYDTYFASQATSTFRTGAVGLARVHNIGFRCALDIRSGNSEAAEPIRADTARRVHPNQNPRLN